MNVASSFLSRAMRGLIAFLHFGTWLWCAPTSVAQSVTPVPNEYIVMFSQFWLPHEHEGVA